MPRPNGYVEFRVIRVIVIAVVLSVLFFWLPLFWVLLF